MPESSEDLSTALGRHPLAAAHGPQGRRRRRAARRQRRLCGEGPGGFRRRRRRRRPRARASAGRTPMRLCSRSTPNPPPNWRDAMPQPTVLPSAPVDLRDRRPRHGPARAPRRASRTARRISSSPIRRSTQRAMCGSRPDARRARAHVFAHAARASPARRLDRRRLALLTPGGRFVMIHRPDRLGEMLTAFGLRLGGVAICPCIRTPGDAIRLMIAGVKGSRAPMRVARPRLARGVAAASRPSRGDPARRGFDRLAG